MYEMGIVKLRSVGLRGRYYGELLAFNLMGMDNALVTFRT
jgi:hypothetical protein